MLLAIEGVGSITVRSVCLKPIFVLYLLLYRLIALLSTSMAAGMNLASIFRVGVIVPESDFSSGVEEAFDSCPPTLEYDRDANSYHDYLSEACRRGDLSAVMEGLQSNVVFLEQVKKLAEVAATENDSEILRYLIQRKQTVSETKNRLDSAAFTATYCGHLQALTCLLDHGTVPDSALDPTTSNSCLHIAVARNHRHIVEELCSRNSRLARVKNKAGLTPLHNAILGGHLELVQYFLKNGLCPPMIISRGGNTVLHCACENNQERIAEFLITQITTEILLQAKNKKGFLPIHFAAAKGNLQLVRMLTDHMEQCNIPCNSMGDSRWTPLHCAAEAGHLEVVKHFCSHHKFTPNAYTTGCRNNINPLHSAALYGKQPVLEYLLSSNKFPRDSLCQIFVHSNALHLAAYRGHTSCCKLLIDDYHLNPSRRTGSGFKAIHLAAGSGKIETVQYFAKMKGHLKAVAGFNKITPLHVAAASCHADVVSWLLSTGKCDPNLPILMTKATSLHLAASAGSHECVKALIADKSCNPNAKAILGVTPLYCATTEVICWELIKHGAVPFSRPDILSQYQFLQSWASVLPSPRLFVVGASGAGKSTLVKSIQLEQRWILGRFFAVTDVDQHTAGVIPVNFESSTFGRVIIYDFAGHEQHYSTHEIEAFLDKAGHSLPIFLLVVDVQQEAEEVKRHISYWRKFLEQATHSSGNQSRIVLVGSHFDCLHTNSERASREELLQALCEDINKGQYPHKGHWITIDCRMPASGSMKKFRDLMKELCNEAKSSLHVDPRAHAFAAFLKHTFRDTTACQLHEIKGGIHAHSPPVTDFLEGLEEVLQNLSEVGSVLYLPDSKKPDNGWIIHDQVLFFQGIHGYKNTVKKMKLDTASGVLSLQMLEMLFEGLSPDMVARYLIHMELCCEIHNHKMLQALSRGDQQLDGRYFLFPDLIEIDAPQEIWQEEGNFTCYSGFVFRCRSAEDFITPRFFHVLLLSIAFTFESDVPLQDCSLWKNGIYWMRNGIQTIVEQTEGGRALFILCRSEERNKMDLINHRAAVHEKVSKVIQKFPAASIDKLYNRDFLFPDLIETDAPQGMWQEQGNFTCYSGFVFRSLKPITPRFFYLLLLRIVFTFAANNSNVPLQDCSLWKNGIYWVKMGIQTIVELTEGAKELLILCRSEERNHMDLIKHRAAVLGKVSEVIQEFPTVSLDKLIIHPQDLHPPHPIILSDQQTRVFRVQDLLQALLTAETPEQQYVRKLLEGEGVRVAATQCHIDDLLHFEPYSLIRGSQLKAVIRMQHKDPIEEQWLFENIASYNKNKWKDMAKVVGIGEEQVQQNVQAVGLCFMDILSEWLKTFSNKPTFKDLCERLDQYSIFRGDDMEVGSECYSSSAECCILIMFYLTQQTLL